MTYAVQQYGSARIVWSTNNKDTAHTLAKQLPGCCVTGIADGAIKGAVYFNNGQRVAIDPPTPVSAQYLAWLVSGHGFVALPQPGARLRG